MSVAFQFASLPDRRGVFDASMRLVDAHPDLDQIGLTFPEGTQLDDQFHIASGSLLGTNLSEGDFTHWVPGVEPIVLAFSFVVDALRKTWPSARIGRVRLMRVRPRKCYSVHRDYTQRIHIPLITNTQALMLWPEVPYVLHMPADGGVWFTDTTLPHTALNGALEDRWHIVAALSEKLDAV